MKKQSLAIIAHVDHGKSTLLTNIIKRFKNVKGDNITDVGDLEKKHGVTIKVKTITLEVFAKGQEHTKITFFDTPGHIDFAHETQVAINASDIILLIIDGSQGPQAQTLHYLNLAKHYKKPLLVAINKIDVNYQQAEKTIGFIEKQNLTDVSIIRCSGRTGEGVEDLIKIITETATDKFKSETSKGLMSKIIDVYNDKYKGLVITIKILSGKIRKGDYLHFGKYKCQVTGTYFQELNSIKDASELEAGDCGAISIKYNEKLMSANLIGKSITNKGLLDDYSLRLNHSIFTSVYAKDGVSHEVFKKEVEKISVNDRGLSLRAIACDFFGSGFILGFLGTFHMMISLEKLKNTGIGFVQMDPQPFFMLNERVVSSRAIDNNNIDSVLSPFAIMDFTSPVIYLSSVLEIIKKCNGEVVSKYMIDQDGEYTFVKIRVAYQHIIDGLISEVFKQSSGYVQPMINSIEYKKVKLCIMKVLINREEISALNTIQIQEFAQAKASPLCKKIRDKIRRQNYKVVINVSLGNKIICREEIKPFTKDVVGKCYGGDRTRKDKLKKKQAAGKKLRGKTFKLDIKKILRE